jgi:hypothetical protein
MLVVFYVRQQFLYFVLSTAFLVVYIFTMVGWRFQKRNVVSIYENGITYRNFAATWNEIKSIRSDATSGITILKSDGDSITINRSVADLDAIAMTIRKHLS